MDIQKTVETVRLMGSGLKKAVELAEKLEEEIKTYDGLQDERDRQIRNAKASIWELEVAPGKVPAWDGVACTEFTNAELLRLILHLGDQIRLKNFNAMPMPPMKETTDHALRYDITDGEEPDKRIKP